MNKIFRPLRFTAAGLVLLLIMVGGELRAQTASEVPSAKSPTLEKQSNAELLESYRLLREQLRAAEQAIVNNRLEAEAAASARTAAISEKLETLRLAMLNERERLKIEEQRTAYERVQQQDTTQAMTQNILRVVITFGGAGLLALFAITLLQWRGNKRMAEYVEQLQPLPAPDRSSWLPVGNGESEPGSESVAHSNQRLTSILDRMEKRVLELENTVVPSAPSAADEPDYLRSEAPEITRDAEPSTLIAELLKRGRSLLDAKKPAEALACFDKILSYDANHAEALLKKGAALERLQKSGEALEYYDRAIEADKNLALAYISKGGLCVRLERFEEALECYEQAMQAGKKGNPSGVARVSVSADWPAKR